MSLLLAATTGAAYSQPLPVAGAVTFSASPVLGAGETGIIQFSPDQGATWINLVSGGTTQQLSPNDTALTVYGPGMYRVSKSATASAVAIYANTGLGR